MIPAVHVQLTGGTGWVITAAVVVIVVSLALLIVSIYNSRAILEDWDNTRDDADYGVRGVNDLREVITAVRAEQTDMREDIGDLLDHALKIAGTQPPGPVSVETAEAAAVLVGHWADGLEQRPTPHKRARTTEGETTDA